MPRVNYVYQVLAELKMNEYEYDSEVIFESKNYKEAKAEYDDILALHDGEDLISLVRFYPAENSSDILASKSNPAAKDEGKCEIKYIDE